MSQDVEAQLKNILQSANWSAQEFATIYKNAIACGNVEVAQSALRILWLKFPREVDLAVSKREAIATACLETAYQKIASEFDLSGNCARNGVMNGLEMDNGAHYVNVFFTYKNREGSQITLKLCQEVPGSDVRPAFTYFDHTDATTAVGYGIGELSDFDKLIGAYKHYLNLLISGSRSYGQ